MTCLHGDKFYTGIMGQKQPEIALNNGFSAY